MIEFRGKVTEQDVMPDIIEYLKESGHPFNVIAPKDADRVSKVNSKAMVLVSCTITERGYYRIQLQDKELYRWTQKLIGESLSFRIIDSDKNERVITAECDALGRLQDAIGILADKYNLSVVVKK